MSLDFNTLPARLLKKECSLLDILSNKDQGAFYTPYWIALRLIEQALENRERPNNRAVQRIIDPACGEGVFLCAYIEFYQSCISKLDPLELAECIYGIDIDRAATKKARENVFKMLSRKVKQGDKEKLKKIIVQNIVHANALEFKNYPKKFIEYIGKFDLVLGNPPWRMQRQRRDFDESMGAWSFKRKSTKNLILAKESWNTDEANRVCTTEEDLYLSFLSLGLDLISKRGIIAQILPDSFLLNQNAESLRSLVLQSGNVTIEGFINSGKAFAADSRKKFILLSLAKSTKTSLRVSFGNKAGKKGPEIIGRNHVNIIQEELKNLSKSNIVPDLRSDIELELLSLMQENSKLRLGDVKFITNNLKFKPNQNFIRGSDIKIGSNLLKSSERILFEHSVSVVWRKVSKDDNVRTLLSTVLFNDQITDSNSVHKISQIEKSQAMSIAAVLNSAVADFFVKTRITVNITKDILFSMPLPDLNHNFVHLSGYLYAFHVLGLSKSVLAQIYSEEVVGLARTVCGQGRLSHEQSLALIDLCVLEAFGIDQGLFIDILKRRFASFLTNYPGYLKRLTIGLGSKISVRGEAA